VIVPERGEARDILVAHLEALLRSCRRWQRRSRETLGTASLVGGVSCSYLVILFRCYSDPNYARLIRYRKPFPFPRERPRELFAAILSRTRRIKQKR
jgi:hypothetical protein